MQNKIYDGGPAFPSEEFFDSSTGKIALGGQGISIRDYFAAKALQGLLSSNVVATVEVFTSKSYEIADAMLKARIN